MGTPFRFNFGEEDEVSSTQEEGQFVNNSDYQTTGRVNSATPQAPLFKEHFLTTDGVTTLSSIIQQNSFSTFYLKQTLKQPEKVLAYCNGKTVSSVFQQANEDGEASGKLVDVLKHSDLNSGVYEGGFKVWECSIDLVEYLHANGIMVSSKDVLEIGCGGGLPGIYCLLSGSRSVCFQDFNAEVIDMFTLPNVMYNATKLMGMDLSRNSERTEDIVDYIKSKCMLLSGNWEESDLYLQKKDLKYDLILSSETIYNPDYYKALHTLVFNSLKRDGIALLANKSYYFGVGGSTKGFLDFVMERGVLTAEIVMQITHGVQRDIIQLKQK